MSRTFGHRHLPGIQVSKSLNCGSNQLRMCIDHAIPMKFDEIWFQKDTPPAHRVTKVRVLAQGIAQLAHQVTIIRVSFQNGHRRLWLPPTTNHMRTDEAERGAASDSKT